MATTIIMIALLVLELPRSSWPVVIRIQKYKRDLLKYEEFYKRPMIFLARSIVSY